MRHIKFVDPASQNPEIKEDVESALVDIHQNGSYVAGPQVEIFEQEFAAYLGVRHVIGVSSGTDALRLALLALQVGPGDEVITTPMTFIATAEAIVQTGARPAFVDVDPVTCNISADALRSYLDAGRFHSPNGPKAILPVHLYGTPAPMQELLSLAEEYQLKVVEDACQAHGAYVKLQRGWVRAGAAGAAGCFSFYPDKNLGAWGEAGAVATNDDDLAARVALLRDHGRISPYAYQECGYNARLDSIQAVVLRAKLKLLDRWNARRREIADFYRKVLNNNSVSLPVEPGYAESCYHLFVIKSEQRDLLRNALLANHIECRIHYPVPLHVQPALRNYDYRSGDFPISENASDCVLSLPMHPYLIDPDLLRVAEVIEQAFRKGQELFLGESYQAAAFNLPLRAE